MAVIGINYREGKAKDLQYKSVKISYANLKKQKIFKSGDFVRDWYNCNKFVIHKISDKEPCSDSSSVDHFIMDGAPYESAYLHVADGKGVLKYIDHSDKNYLYTQREIYEEGIEFFVAKGTKPTWDELRKLCKDEKKIKKQKKNDTRRKN